MPYYVYILKSQSRDAQYLGQTQDLAKRLALHNKGYVRSTRAYVPWKLYAYKEYESRSVSMSVERQLKNMKRRQRHEAYIEKNAFVTNEEQDVISTISVPAARDEGPRRQVVPATGIRFRYAPLKISHLQAKFVSGFFMCIQLYILFGFKVGWSQNDA